MRSPWFLLVPLAAPLFFINPAEAAVLPSCCTQAGMPQADGDPEQERPRFLVPAEVRRRDERALEATAEAPVPVDVPLVDAIGIPLEERPGVSEPDFAPAPVVVEPPPFRIYADDPIATDGPRVGPPCCQAEAETKSPDPRDEEKPPVLVPAEVETREERALEAAVEAPIPAKAPRVNAIGIPLEERRGVSEPEYVAATADDLPAWLRTLLANAELMLALFVILLAIRYGLYGRRRQLPELEPLAVPVRRPPLPEELTRHLGTPVPLFEPPSPPAVETTPALDREPA